MAESGDRASPNVALSPKQRANKPLRRAKWACDQCRTARSRCDGNVPCARCQEYGRVCAYDRKPKSRGRPPGKSKNARKSPAPAHPATLSQVGLGVSPRLLNRQPDLGNWDPLDAFQNAASTLENVDFDPVGTSESVKDSVVPTATSVDTICHSYNGFVERDIGNTVVLSSTGGSAALSRSFRDTLDTSEFHVQRPTGARIEPRREHAEHLPELASAHAVPESWESTASTNESIIGCPYTVLQPILPHICHIIPADVACDMLDYFFNDPGVAVFQIRIPYNLAAIFRTSSFLRLKEPRPTSPALLAAILFVSAQTCDEKLFRSRNHVRAGICDELLTIVVRLLGDAAPAIYPRNATAPSLTEALSTETWLTLDNTIATILCGIVISGSDHKLGCLMWFDRARMMAVILELNREQTQPPVQSEQFRDEKDIVAEEERKEEQRRTWWLLYAMDRHLACCYNAPVHLLDSKCQVYQPLREDEWQQLDLHLAVAQSPDRPFGPPSEVTGLGFFQFFLPFMVVLGDIITLHHFRLNSRYQSLVHGPLETVTEMSLQRLRDSVARFSGEADMSLESSNSPMFPARDGGTNTTRIVATYGAFLVHAMAILTYGDWDIITMLRNGSSTVPDDRVTKFTHHTVLASQAMDGILDCDPELTFMPYLLGIYILHVGFAVLVVAENNGAQASRGLREVIETFIRAHESCIATLDTKYQRDFRKVLRDTLRVMKAITGSRLTEHLAQRDQVLSMYRWNADGHGLLFA